jgi:hypothetical protein
MYCTVLSYCTTSTVGGEGNVRQYLFRCAISQPSQVTHEPRRPIDSNSYLQTSHGTIRKYPRFNPTWYTIYHITCSPDLSYHVHCEVLQHPQNRSIINSTTLPPSVQYRAVACVSPAALLRISRGSAKLKRTFRTTRQTMIALV